MSVQIIFRFENFRPEENWQCIAFDPFSTVSYGVCLTVVPPKRGISKLISPDSKYGTHNQVLHVLTANMDAF